jgi:hypothetical protein
MRTTALLVVLAGCSFPTKPGPPFSCNGEGLPTQRPPDTIHIRGAVADPQQHIMLPDATETGFLIASSPLQTFTAHTDSTGSFMGSMTTEGSTYLQFIQSHIDGYLDTFAYSALPVADDIYVPVQQFTQEGFGELAVAGGLPPSSLAAPMIVSVVDCNDDAVAGATLTVTQEQNPMVQVIYFSGLLPDPNRHETDSNTAAAVVAGLNPGPVHVSATFRAIRYFPHDVAATLGAMTFTEVSPY